MWSPPNGVNMAQNRSKGKALAFHGDHRAVRLYPPALGLRLRLLHHPVRQFLRCLDHRRRAGDHRFHVLCGAACGAAPSADAPLPPGWRGMGRRAAALSEWEAAWVPVSSITPETLGNGALPQVGDLSSAGKTIPPNVKNSPSVLISHY